MSPRLPVNNSYYPLPIGAYGTPPRSPPPLNHFHRPSRSGSADGEMPLATSSVVQDDTGDTEHIDNTGCDGPLVRHPDLWFSDGSVRTRSPVTRGIALTQCWRLSFELRTHSFACTSPCLLGTLVSFTTCSRYHSLRKMPSRCLCAPREKSKTVRCCTFMTHPKTSPTYSRRW